MKQKLFVFGVLIVASFFVIALIGLLDNSNKVVLAAGERSLVLSSSNKTLADPVSVITVTSSTDPNDSKSETCYTGSSAVAPCTLRRAIVEARNLSDSQKPVLIKFDIPTTLSEGYDSSLKIWRIKIYENIIDTAVFRRLNGGIIIDGTTQPGGRTKGPKILIVGPKTGSKDGLIVGDTASDNGHVIRGLGFQNFKTHMYVNSGENLIEDNWFGLSDDGTSPYLRNDDPEDGSGNAGISLQATANNSTIQNNVFIGFDGVAAAIRGDINTFSNNYVGTNLDGVVTGKETEESLICQPGDWLGGGGISVDGDDHVIDTNIFAGLRQDIYVISTPPSAIQVGGDGHTITNNKIGVDSGNNQVGVCGRGIYLISDPENNQISDNTIVYPGLSGISLNGALYDANTLRRNTIKSKNWIQVEGNSKPEDAIQLGSGLPDGFEFFIPAKVTEINGTTVKGESGTGSPCPGCVIELFLDDTDLITEALKSLAVVTAGSDGKWTTSITSNLIDKQGIRTTSTSMKYNTIPNMSAGTTTGLSELYKAAGGGSPEGPMLFLPFVINKD